ncbi:MAG TPA: hypothetical protein VEQ11_14780 [Chloroflexota bacterium]|nr:hypothetical protein [Chloroflexota bacterium]
MTTKDRLHRLIDELPESELVAAERLLERLRNGARGTVVADGTVDDEPLSMEDLVAVQEGIDAIGRGDFVTLREYEARRKG